MRSVCAVFSSVAFVPLQYFFTISHKRQEFRKKENELGEARDTYGGMRRV